MKWFRTKDEALKSKAWYDERKVQYSTSEVMEAKSVNGYPIWGFELRKWGLD